MTTNAIDLDDVLQRHRNVARALSENGTPEETLQGWHAFAGWLRNGMPDEPDVRGPVPDTAATPVAELERLRGIERRARELAVAGREDGAAKHYRHAAAFILG